MFPKSSLGFRDRRDRRLCYRRIFFVRVALRLICILLGTKERKSHFMEASLPLMLSCQNMEQPTILSTLDALVSPLLSFIMEAIVAFRDFIHHVGQDPKNTAHREQFLHFHEEVQRFCSFVQELYEARENLMSLEEVSSSHSPNTTPNTIVEHTHCLFENFLHYFFDYHCVNLDLNYRSKLLDVLTYYSPLHPSHPSFSAHLHTKEHEVLWMMCDAETEKKMKLENFITHANLKQHGHFPRGRKARKGEKQRFERMLLVE